MKTRSIIIKSLKEQLRSYWVLLLTLSMGPFFIFVYFLISESTKSDYNMLVVNNDKGVMMGERQINHGAALMAFFETMKSDSSAIPVTVTLANNKSAAIESVKSKKADGLIILPATFSKDLTMKTLIDTIKGSSVEFYGDLTNTNYLISAIWSNEILTEYGLLATQGTRTVEVREIALGTSSKVSDFEVMVPGLLIVSIIMLMFTASIAFVSEVENKTIMRLKLSKLQPAEFLTGISIVQLIIGVFSALLTLFTAIGLGFSYAGSIWIMILIACLTSLSIIAFSLIIAAVTKTVNEVLIVGNFPMFLFMFFTGAAFPMKSTALFTIAGYPITIQGLMSPTHAISALNKTLIMNMNLTSIIPEVLSIVVLTGFYFLIGGLIFNQRHLKLS